MSAMPLVLSSFGLVTGVGLDAPSTCAAIRCAIDAFEETRFMDSGGEWIMGCEVALEQPWRGKTKLIRMAAMALRETLEQCPDIVPEQTPLMLCLAESHRPGRAIDDDNQFFFDLCAELGLEFHAKSRVIPQGHVSVGAALSSARDLISTTTATRVLVAAVDSMLIASSVAAYEEQDRLLTSKHTNGFMPGEGAAAFLVTVDGYSSQPAIRILGLGAGEETATMLSGGAMRGDGMTRAYRDALGQARINMADIAYQISALNGEQYWFKEINLATSRLLRGRHDFIDLWHPAHAIGEVGAVSFAVCTAVGYFAAKKGYAPGSKVMVSASNDDGRCCASILDGRSVG